MRLFFLARASVAAYRAARAGVSCTLRSIRRFATATLHVKVVPRAARDEVVGWLAGALRVRVAAAPEAGRANAALEALLAAVLGVRKSAVRVVSGHAAPRKRIEVEGLPQDELERRLNAAGF